MKKVFKLLAITMLVALSAGSCRKPYQEQKYVIVEPNETAYLIPLEQGNKDAQGKLDSESYLEDNKVSSKRIYVPTQWHQTGRRSNSGQWIPSVRIIKVDRSPVTREWTAANGTGTSGNKKEDIEVESKESIGFGIGITATANIPQEWASRFLYKYSGRTLAEVMDSDVRSYIQKILTSEFGKYELSECQNNRSKVFSVMEDSVTKHFESFGVKIMNIGAAGQFNYLEESIQKSINEKFASEMKIETADNEVIAANKFLKAQRAIEAQKKLDVSLKVQDAISEAIRTGKLPVPNSLTIINNGSGSKMSLMDLYASSKIGK